MATSNLQVTKTAAARTLGSDLARGARAARAVVPEVLSPVGAGLGVGAVWGGIVGLTSLKRYSDGKISGKDAVLTTAGESVGLGLAAGLGVLAGNVVRASLLVTAISASALIPFLAGVVITSSAKILWDRSIKKHL